MKSVSVAAAAAVLAGVAVAQPHGNHLHHQRLHAKRELVTEWETKWETVTVVVDDDSTLTILPTTTPGSPGEFFQPSTTTSSTPSSTSTSTSEVVIAETPTTSTKKAAPTTPTSTYTPPPPPPSTTSTTSTPVVVVPTTTSVAPPPPSTTSKAAAPTTTSSGGSTGGSGGGKAYSGDITYYAVGLGACGYDDAGKDDKMPIVAIAVGDWGAYGTMATNAGLNMPLNPWCGKELSITANGKTVKGVARDQCPGCEPGSIDVSEKIFMELFGDLGVGRTSVSWTVDS